MPDITLPDTWMLDDLDESIDIQEDDDGITQIREHIVIKIHRRMHASEIPSRLSILATQSTVTYHVGAISKTNNPAGSGKFTCVADGVTPEAHPGEFVFRRQTWEFFDLWQTAPPEFQNGGML